MSLSLGSHNGIRERQSKIHSKVLVRVVGRVEEIDLKLRATFLRNKEFFDQKSFLYQKLQKNSFTSDWYGALALET